VPATGLVSTCTAMPSPTASMMPSQTRGPRCSGLTGEKPISMAQASPGLSPGRASATASAMPARYRACQGKSRPGPPMSLSVSAAIARYEYSGCSSPGTSLGVTRLLMLSG